MQKGVKDFKTMMEKGVLVTTDGCILPHKQYGVRGQGSTLKGYQRSAYFFTGQTPARMAKTKKGGAIRDTNGWPMDSQISHLCHRSDCVRPDHLQQELRVINLRRNWCGILGRDGCDCGMTPPCVRMYHPAEWQEPDLSFCRSKEQVREVLATMPDTFKHTLLDRSKVVANAKKAENAEKRKRASDKSTAAVKRTKL